MTEESMWNDWSSGWFHSSSVLFVEVSIGLGTDDMKRYRLERRKFLPFSALTLHTHTLSLSLPILSYSNGSCLARVTLGSFVGWFSFLFSFSGVIAWYLLNDASCKL